MSIGPDARFAWTIDVEGNVKVWKIDKDNILSEECIIKDNRSIVDEETELENNEDVPKIENEAK